VNNSVDVSVPEPAPLTVVSNAELLAQAEEFEREKAAEQTLRSAINNEKPTSAPEVNEQLPGTSEHSNGGPQDTALPMDIERSPREEGIASPTPPPPEYVLPEGAVLDKPVVTLRVFYFQPTFLFRHLLQLADLYREERA
jgi:hypothetical protein